MSKTMQLTVRILPYFEKDMKSDYPKISQGLSYIHKAWAEEGASLFDIVGRLDKLLTSWKEIRPLERFYLSTKTNSASFTRKLKNILRIGTWPKPTRHCIRLRTSLIKLNGN